LRLYETTFIIRQDASASQVETLAQQFADVIREHGGQVLNTELCGLRTLAYRIKKNRKGHYILLDISAPTAAVQEMERQMRLNEDIIRLLTVTVDEHGPRPSPLMQSKFSRDDNPRFDDGGGFHRDREDDSERTRVAPAVITAPETTGDLA